MPKLFQNDFKIISFHM